jgi:hypothetical protein
MQEFDEELDKKSDEIDPDEFKDFLGGFGIGLSDD